MDNPLLVHKVNAEEELLHYYLDLFLFELNVLEDLAEEGALLLIFEDHVHEIFIFVDFEQAEEAIALLDVPVDFYLSDEVFRPILTALQFLLIEDLDGNQVRARIRGQLVTSLIYLLVNMVSASPILGLLNELR